MKKFLIAILALIAVMFMVINRAPGVDLTVINVGSAPLKAVTVQVTGRSYRLGDIKPGSSKSIKVNPTAESTIQLIFSDGRRLDIDSYFERGYRGTITAEVTSTRVVSVKNDMLRPPLY